MSELSGFSPINRLGRTFEPQSLRVPSTRAELVAGAIDIVGALWDAVDADLSPNVTLEILKIAGATACRISPWDRDGVTKTVANPGDWVVVDAGAIRGLSEEDYAAEFTKASPIEWSGTATPPAATAEPGLTATITTMQPTSANRPFTYTATVTDHTTNRAKAGGITIEERATRVYVKMTGLIDGHEYSGTIAVGTQYEGIEATSLPSNRFTAFDKPAEPLPPVEPPPASIEPPPEQVS